MQDYNNKMAALHFQNNLRSVLFEDEHAHVFCSCPFTEGERELAVMYNARSYDQDYDKQCGEILVKYENGKIAEFRCQVWNQWDTITCRDDIKASVKSFFVKDYDRREFSNPSLEINAYWIARIYCSICIQRGPSEETDIFFERFMKRHMIGRSTSRDWWLLACQVQRAEHI